MGFEIWNVEGAISPKLRQYVKKLVLAKTHMVG